MESLVTQAYSHLPFEEMLLTIYPRDLLTLPSWNGMHRSSYYPVPHLVPYAHKKLTNIFLERVGLSPQKGRGEIHYKSCNVRDAKYGSHETTWEDIKKISSSLLKS